MVGTGMAGQVWTTKNVRVLAGVGEPLVMVIVAGPVTIGPKMFWK